MELNIKKVLVPYVKKWGWNTGVEHFVETWFESENKISNEI